VLDGLTTAFLIQDGLTSGVVYALIALAMILIFAVTRVLFIALGEFVAFAALTMSALELGKVPGTVYVLLVLAVACTTVELGAIFRARTTGVAGGRGAVRGALVVLAQQFAIPAVIAGAMAFLAPRQPDRVVTAFLTVALVTAMGPMIYRLVFQRIADASPLALLFVSVAVHYVLLGIGISCFGAEGWRTQAFWKTQLTVGPLTIPGQAIVVWLVAGGILLGLWLFFTRSYPGRVLIATARNRKGARLMGVRSEFAGKLAFGFAAGISALSGILISPTITFYYDSGFLIMLKGLVAAVIGAMSSYPLAAAGALAVGVTESFAAFFASTFKEAIVFLLLVPFLLWMSLRAGRVPEVEED
jgi:branched-chain amino acid transport system permease protein